MTSKSGRFFSNIFKFLPVFLLFFIAFSEYSFSFTIIETFSFNFSYILVFYWILRKPEVLGYGFIFLAGLINDIVVGHPIGISSVSYLVLCGFAAYIRDVTLRPYLINDWIAFAPSILITNSIYFLIITYFFDQGIDYLKLIINTFITFLVYPLFAIIFNFLSNKIVRGS